MKYGGLHMCIRLYMHTFLLILANVQHIHTAHILLSYLDSVSVECAHALSEGWKSLYNRKHIGNYVQPYVTVNSAFITFWIRKDESIVETYFLFPYWAKFQRLFRVENTAMHKQGGKLFSFSKTCRPGQKLKWWKRYWFLPQYHCMSTSVRYCEGFTINSI